MGDKDYINDFASDDYVTKNIRVMPMGSGVSIENTSEYTSKYMSGMRNVEGGAHDSDTEEQKHNQDAEMQMHDQRMHIKEMRAEAERKALEAAEREAKLKQKMK